MRVKGANERDRVVGALADRQHGVVSREQLLRAGVGRGAIARGVEAGRLRPPLRGVYAVGHVAVRTGHGRKRARIAAHRTRLDPVDVVVIDGLRVTMP